MTISLIWLLIALCVVAVLLYCAKLLLAVFAIPQPLGTILYVLVILICLVIVLQSIGGIGGWGVIHLR